MLSIGAFRLLEQGHPGEIVEVDIPSVAAGQVRLMVAGSGFCHSDLHVMHAPSLPWSTPFTLGHQTTGWVDAVGSGVNRIVVGSPLGATDLVLNFVGVDAAMALAADLVSRIPSGATLSFRVLGYSPRADGSVGAGPGRSHRPGDRTRRINRSTRGLPAADCRHLVGRAVVVPGV